MYHRQSVIHDIYYLLFGHPLIIYYFIYKSLTDFKDFSFQGHSDFDHSLLSWPGYAGVRGWVLGYIPGKQPRSLVHALRYAAVWCLRSGTRFSLPVSQTRDWKHKGICRLGSLFSAQATPRFSVGSAGGSASGRTAQLRMGPRHPPCSCAVSCWDARAGPLVIPAAAAYPATACRGRQGPGRHNLCRHLHACDNPGHDCADL